ncbi:Fc.00g014950.m01.CDS01 [Cosmosporella sp. VM-42]
MTHSENAMARFLLAILNQKNLKDIDWNQVAADPVLLQPITNGHAARMRFARFRQTVTGHEPQKRSKTADKSRVTKSKKAQQPKRDSLVKSESGVSLSSYAQVRRSPKIKQEQNQPAYLAQFSPASMSSPYITDGRDDFNPRFLTPCSDDMTHAIAVNPASLEDLRHRNFGPSIDCNPDFLQHTGHEHAVLPQSPNFGNFDAEYDLSSYRAADAHSPSTLDLNVGQSLADCGQDWTDRFHDQHY